MAVDDDKLASGLAWHSNAYWSSYELANGTADSTGGSYTVHPAVNLRTSGEGTFNDNDYERVWWKKGLEAVSGLQAAYEESINTVVASLDNWLLDVASEELENPNSTPSPNQILDYLSEHMVGNAQTMERSLVSVGSVTLNQASSDASGAFIPYASGPTGGRGSGMTDNQLVLNGNLFRLLCTSDSTAGEEIFNVTCSEVGKNGALATITITALTASSEEASGETFSASVGKTLIQDGDFTSSVGGVGNSVGAYFGDTASGASDFTTASGNTMRGAGLKLTASGGGADTHFIGQSFADLTNVLPLDVLCCTFVYKATAGSTGTATVIPFGTDYTAPTGQSVAIDTSSAATVWSRSSFFFTLPRDIPSDFGIKIQAASLDKQFHIDELIIAKPSVLQGVSMLKARDYPDHTIGDEMTFSTTSDRAGKVAEMLAREKNVNMPVGDSPTYPDS